MASSRSTVAQSMSAARSRRRVARPAGRARACPRRPGSARPWPRRAPRRSRRRRGPRACARDARAGPAVGEEVLQGAAAAEAERAHPVARRARRGPRAGAASASRSSVPSPIGRSGADLAGELAAGERGAAGHGEPRGPPGGGSAPRALEAQPAVLRDGAQARRRGPARRCRRAPPSARISAAREPTAGARRPGPRLVGQALEAQAARARAAARRAPACSSRRARRRRRRRAPRPRRAAAPACAGRWPRRPGAGRAAPAAARGAHAVAREGVGEALRRVLAPRQPALGAVGRRLLARDLEQRPHQPRRRARRMPEQRPAPGRGGEPVEHGLDLVGRRVAGRRSPRHAARRAPRRLGVAPFARPRLDVAAVGHAGVPAPSAATPSRSHSVGAERLGVLGRIGPQPVVDVQRARRRRASRTARSSRQTESRPPESSTSTGSPGAEQPARPDARLDAHALVLPGRRGTARWPRRSPSAAPRRCARSPGAAPPPPPPAASPAPRRPPPARRRARRG